VLGVARVVGHAAIWTAATVIALVFMFDASNVAFIYVQF
jgi:hypothetical protein